MEHESLILCYTMGYIVYHKGGLHMKCVVLLSGGVDSTTCLAMALTKYKKDDVLALTAYYGQKHAKELEAPVR